MPVHHLTWSFAQRSTRARANVETHGMDMYQPYILEPEI